VATDLELLERFKPRVLFDSLEAFFADSAAEMTDNAGNTLRAGPAAPKPGELLADAAGGLSLTFLGREKYGSKRPVGKGDRLSIKGNDYRSQYVRLIAANPNLRDRMYGRVHGNDTTGRKWLQYWFFYFYDDPALAARVGFHEGDWEMIQLLVEPGDSEPSVAVYAQHNYASSRDWDDVQKDASNPDTPLVYSARGSHASYFEPGLYDTEAWFDVADGEGPSRNLELEVIGGAAPAWALWPGRWGDTEPGEGKLKWLMRLFKGLRKIQSASPDAPCAHSQWCDPDKLLSEATARAPTLPSSSEPRPELPVTVSQLGTRLRVAYDLGPSPPVPPGWLVVNVKSPGLPPRSFTIDVRGKRRGRWFVPWLELENGHRYEVSTSLVGTDRSATAVGCTVVQSASPPWRQRTMGAIGHFFAKLAQSIGLLRTRLPPAPG
jgi:hypothetical protein